MGVTMSFFAATNAQLTAAAPGWVVAEYGALRKVMARNPFTGKELGEITQWECLSRAPEGGLEDDDLHVRLPITILEAWRGAKVKVPTPGGEVTLTVKRGWRCGVTGRSGCQKWPWCRAMPRTPFLTLRYRPSLSSARSKGRRFCLVTTGFPAMLRWRLPRSPVSTGRQRGKGLWSPTAGRASRN